MRLGELIAHRPFGLEMVNPATLQRVVKGAHAIDVPEPARWIQSGYVVLTTGVGVRDSVEQQQRFAHAIADADATALGFGVDIVFKSPPRPMLAVAQARSLPVFTVPFETPFREIIRFVTQSTLRHDSVQLARVVAMQGHLLAAIEEPNGDQEIVNRLSAMLDARVALFSAEGTPIALAGHPPLAELWGLAISGSRGSSMARGGYVTIRPLEDGGYLTLVAREVSRVEAVERPLMSFAARAIQTLAATRGRVAEDERVARCQALHDLLDADYVDRELVGRMRAFGFHATHGLRVLVASVGATTQEARRLCTELDESLAQISLARLIDVYENGVLAAWESDEPVSGLKITFDQATARAGVSSAVSDVTAFPLALAEARAALAVAFTGEDQLVEYPSLGLADSLVAMLEPNRLTAATELLGSLRNAGAEMVSTLVAFFEHNMEVSACARALYLHPNSLRYRLAKVEKVVGRSLRSPQTVADLYLALRAEQLHRHSDLPI